MTVLKAAHEFGNRLLEALSPYLVIGLGLAAVALLAAAAAALLGV